MHISIYFYPLYTSFPPLLTKLTMITGGLRRSRRRDAWVFPFQFWPSRSNVWYVRERVVRWGEVRRGEARWGEVRWGEVRWGEVRWGEVRWGEELWRGGRHKDINIISSTMSLPQVQLIGSIAAGIRQIAWTVSYLMKKNMAKIAKVQWAGKSSSFIHAENFQYPFVISAHLLSSPLISSLLHLITLTHLISWQSWRDYLLNW